MMGLNFEKILEDRILQVRTCTHIHRKKLNEYKTIFDHYELEQCQECGIKFWVMRTGSQTSETLFHQMASF